MENKTFKNCVLRSQVPLRSYQIKVINFINDPDNNSLLVVHGTGTGKCEGYNTPNLMYDGSIKMVQNIKIGDLLMGPDSNPRKVLSLGRGQDIMYEIIPDKGEIYTFNSEHILSLKCTYKNNIYKNKNKWCCKWFDNKFIKIKSTYFNDKISAKNYLNNLDEKTKFCNISIKDYLKLNNKIKHWLKLYKTSIEFSKKEIPYDPYYFGIWLDNEITDNNIEDLINLYKINSREIRLQLLAGIIDSSGYLQYNKFYKFTNENEKIIDRIIYIARSLGYNSNKNFNKISLLYTAKISGNIENIPCRIKENIPLKRKKNKDVLTTNFKIIKKGLDNYYGFTLDNDHLYLLGDFTVTHNTLSALVSSQCYLDNFPINTVIVISPASITGNFEKEIKKYGSNITDKYKFYSFDKFIKENKNICKNSMIIIDEIHNMRSMKSRYDAIYNCVKNCHKLLLLTATPYVNSLLDFKPIINLLYRDDKILRKKKINIYDARPMIIKNQNYIASYLQKLYSNYIETDEEYKKVLSGIEYILKNKVSFVSDKNNEYFPKVIIKKIELTMSKEFYNKYYYSITSGDFGKNPQIFYSGYRQAVNLIGSEKYLNQKLDIIEEIVLKMRQTIIYTNWLESGVNILNDRLNKLNIKYKTISGSINSKIRMNIVEEYNNKIFQVLIITKAGSEGLDLKETRNIIILDPVWSPSVLDQIIGRGVRFKSHYNLPKEKQIVNVYLMILNTPKFSSVPSGDQLLYDILDRKNKVKNDIEKILKEISI